MRFFVGDAGFFIGSGGKNYTFFASYVTYSIIPFKY